MFWLRTYVVDDDGVSVVGGQLGVQLAEAHPSSVGGASLARTRTPTSKSIYDASLSGAHTPTRISGASLAGAHSLICTSGASLAGARTPVFIGGASVYQWRLPCGSAHTSLVVVPSICRWWLVGHLVELDERSCRVVAPSCAGRVPPLTPEVIHTSYRASMRAGSEVQLGLYLPHSGFGYLEFWTSPPEPRLLGSRLARAVHEPEGNACDVPPRKLLSSRC